jgi:hypothetical protein
VLLNGKAVATATVDDTTTGSSLIKSAEYSLDNVNWLPMAVVDGTFDVVSEAVTATFTAASLGQSQICVRGTDQFDNVGAPVCAPLTTQYGFKGFKPHGCMGNANKANTGQAIPLIWLLFDAHKKPISDKASYVAVILPG